MNEILIRKAKKGDKDAFCRLIDENVQSMYKVAAAYLKNDEDVADAIQDTILSCYENLKSLKQNRYFKTWMIRILINKCKDMIQLALKDNLRPQAEGLCMYMAQPMDGRLIRTRKQHSSCRKFNQEPRQPGNRYIL